MTNTLAGSGTGPSAPSPRGVIAAVRRHPLAAFLAWFFTVGQAIAFVPVVAGANGAEAFTRPLVAQSFILASTVVGLLLPAVVVTRIVDGPDRARELLRRAFRLGVPLRWYALALLGVPALATALAVAFLGAPAAGVSASAVLSALVFGLLMQTVVAFVPNNWAEEVAWTGFVQARLQARHGALRAALVAGPLFALQHVSLVVGAGAAGVVLMAVLVVLAVPFRALTGWTYNRTGSLFVVGVLHAAGNAVAGGSGYGAGLLPRLYPEDAGVVGAMHLLALAVVGVVVMVATRGRLGAGARP
ncbi:MAG TPA: type II CAAX endopeptidase family protein [Pseudonocardia sp.]|nr:type II CAAX endopeptidase family protein [Pseudonocardia sp.]